MMMLRLQGHEAYVSGVAFSPDGAMIGSSSWDDSVRVWEVASGECRATLQVRVRIPHFNNVNICMYLVMMPCPAQQLTAHTLCGAHGQPHVLMVPV